jgi:hypothetical protein
MLMQTNLQTGLHPVDWSILYGREMDNTRPKRKRILEERIPEAFWTPQSVMRSA